MPDQGQLYFNGDIITVDSLNPGAEAVATKKGKIVAVGSKFFCASQLGGKPEEINLNGHTLLPGFIDTHLHPTLMILYEIYTDCSDLKSMEELKHRFKKICRDKPETEWILGLQFEEQYFDNPQFPCRHDLDEACPDHPVVLLKRDGHSLIANTKAMKEAGISSHTEEPDNGTIEREEDGHPSGVFREKAMDKIITSLPLPEIQTVLDAASSIFKKITRFGITSVSIILQTDSEGVMGEQGALDVPLMEMVMDQIPISMYSMFAAKNVESIIKLKNSRLHQEPGVGHSVGALKLWMDGSFSSCTSKMEAPFSDYPDMSGMLMDTPDAIYKRMVDGHKAGLQLAVHSIGDKSTRICLELYDRLLTEFPKKDHRHRIEHASIMDQKSILEFARLGIVASVQPMFIASEKNWLHKRLGRERAKWVYPFRSFLDAGVMVSGSSDAPIEILNVLHGIRSCVTRDGFEMHQAISVAEAIKMYTINAAFAQFEENFKGSITPGKRADMVILNTNPLKVPAREINAIVVEKTICNGNPI